MISKLLFQKHSQNHFQIQFQTCVPNQKVQGNEPTLHS
jgi:hypothetical protein